MPLFKNPDAATPVLGQFSLKGKVCAVTGGARGIGIEIVRGLAEAGADVAIIYSSTNADAFAAEVSGATGVRVKGYQASVASRQSMVDAVDAIVADFGRLDVMIANAGVCADINALDYTEDSWAQNAGVNYDGVMWTAQAAGRQFKKQGKGNLIITASISGSVVNIPQTQVAYNSAKAGAVHLGKSLAVEWIDFARVNIVSPGYISSESRWPRRRALWGSAY
jgi:sorbose reductase